MQTIILIGFSTTGKSHFAKRLCEINPFEINFQDSDKFAAKEYDNHIYNIFMALGHDRAIEYITKKEQEFIKNLANKEMLPTLVAAGPFLVIRGGWDNYCKVYNPYIIYLKKRPETVYADLISRKEKQKMELDISNPNFGCWDEGVTTEKINGKYYDIDAEKALLNIKNLINSVDGIYKKYSCVTFDSDLLKSSVEKSDEFVQVIIDKLK